MQTGQEKHSVEIFTNTIVYRRYEIAGLIWPLTFWNQLKNYRKKIQKHLTNSLKQSSNLKLQHKEQDYIRELQQQQKRSKY